MKNLLNKDKYLSILIVLGLVLVASYGNKSPLTIVFTILVYIALGKVIIKLAYIVQNMISDVRNMFK